MLPTLSDAVHTPSVHCAGIKFANNRACRFMSLPLHDQERLGNHSKRGAFDHLPLGVSQRPATHQGLFLDATEDVLVGRAENGAPSSCSCWLSASAIAPSEICNKL